MTNELTYEQETVRSVFGAYINDLKAYSSKPDRPTFRKLEEVRDKAIQALESQHNLTNKELYQAFIKLEAENERLHEALESSISIPSDATNGDAIKAVFPSIKLGCHNEYMYRVAGIMSNHETYSNLFFKDWWNTLYKEEYNEINT